MITLFAAGAGFGLPEISPYATKTEVQLMMAKLPYRKTRGSRETAPKGQLPWIEDAAQAIGDSTFIRAHIERKYNVDLDIGLTGRERAQAWAIERMIENQLGWVSSYFRFLDPANFDKGPGRWFDQAPAHLREDLRRGLREAVAANVRAVGVGRHLREEVVWLGSLSLRALDELLEDKTYLMRDTHPVGVDATAFAMLAAILTPFFDSPLREEAEDYPRLVAYVGRMMARFYPAHPWGLRQAA
ncbi:glutathione S-transferase family protein [uncultured Caulobacter sp.]|uniref:glutathione S-transferase family protein n=1 Tax=uncultured Caulobacter sp. TaxID=158749 RepID=UPI002638AF1E|nr:glutathione S-transferase family protein [uncultured Caulobacter sp.]